MTTSLITAGLFVFNQNWHQGLKPRLPACRFFRFICKARSNIRTAPLEHSQGRLAGQLGLPWASPIPPPAVTQEAQPAYMARPEHSPDRHHTFQLELGGVLFGLQASGGVAVGHGWEVQVGWAAPGALSQLGERARSLGPVAAGECVGWDGAPEGGGLGTLLLSLLSA